MEKQLKFYLSKKKKYRIKIVMESIKYIALK
jgi:hypothetical protein